MPNNLFVSFKKVCLEICLFLSKEKADFPWFYQENRPYERAGIRTRDNLIKSQVLYRLSYTPAYLLFISNKYPQCPEPESNQ